jgi:hypothetical protein
MVGWDLVTGPPIEGGAVLDVTSSASAKSIDWLASAPA